jgi:predicted nucleic acid-binding Zn ribbon protein
MKLARLIGSGAGIIFKGSGFYETDYKRKSQAKPSETDSPETKKPDSASSDSSPAQKPAGGDSKPVPTAKAS